MLRNQEQDSGHSAVNRASCRASVRVANAYPRNSRMPLKPSISHYDYHTPETPRPPHTVGGRSAAYARNNERGWPRMSWLDSQSYVGLWGEKGAMARW